MDPALTLPQKREVLRPFNLANKYLKALAQHSKFNMRFRLTLKVIEVGSTMRDIRLRCEKSLATFLSDCLKKVSLDHPHSPSWTPTPKMRLHPCSLLCVAAYWTQMSLLSLL
ncbi:hypothetical protein L0F63_001145, partial [Massospora cicadina]